MVRARSSRLSSRLFLLFVYLKPKSNRFRLFSFSYLQTLTTCSYTITTKSLQSKSSIQGCKPCPTRAVPEVAKAVTAVSEAQPHRNCQSARGRLRHFSCLVRTNRCRVKEMAFEGVASLVVHKYKLHTTMYSTLPRHFDAPSHHCTIH